MDDKNEKAKHTVTILEQKHIKVTGVDSVTSFDDREIALMIGEIQMTIEGRDLHISELSLESGRVSADGRITGVYYEDREKSVKNGFFKRKG